MLRHASEVRLTRIRHTTSADFHKISLTQEMLSTPKILDHLKF